MRCTIPLKINIWKAPDRSHAYACFGDWLTCGSSEWSLWSFPHDKKGITTYFKIGCNTFFITTYFKIGCNTFFICHDQENIKLMNQLFVLFNKHYHETNQGNAVPVAVKVSMSSKTTFLRQTKYLLCYSEHQIKYFITCN